VAYSTDVGLFYGKDVRHKSSRSAPKQHVLGVTGEVAELHTAGAVQRGWPELCGVRPVVALPHLHSMDDCEATILELHSGATVTMQPLIHGSAAHNTLVRRNRPTGFG
jgi:hypothetical protein